MPKVVKRLKTASTRSEQKKNGIPASKGSLRSTSLRSERYAYASLFRFASLNICLQSKLPTHLKILVPQNISAEKMENVVVAITCVVCTEVFADNPCSLLFLKIK